MMWGNENPTQMYMIDGDITKTLTNCATDPLYATRQEYARMLLFFLRHQPLEEIMKNIHGITSTLLMIAEDKTSSVRLHLADQIVGIILQVREHASPDLEYYLYDRLLQILLKYFQDDDYLVKAAASSAFNLLLDEGAIDKKMLIEGAYPTILSCTKNYDDEVEKGRTATAVALMGRIAPVLGGEALALFLDNYLEMCSRAAMSIRYPCAKIFPVMCQVLGTKITDERLLDAFVAMASSEEWEELRKICAENLALVALVCSPECRRDRLTRIVLKLAKDPSRNIVNATFKVLGQFIATFSTPKIISLAYTQEGELYITNPLHSDFSKHSDPKVVASYNDYINRADDSTTMQSQMHESSLSKSLSSLKVSSPTSTISSSPSFSSLSTSSSLKTIKYNNDSLSRKEILQIIKNNILEINKQMTESSFKASDMDPAEYELEFMASNEEDENADGDSLNNYLTAQDASSTSEVVQSSTYTAGDPSLNSIDRENNSRNSEDENFQNNGMQSDVPGKKFRTSIPAIEHFWRKNTPADLSAIIKNAIVEAKKLPQQPLYEKRKLILPPPPTAAIDLPTPTSEEPSRSLAWDDFISNDHSKSKSTDRLNECQVDEANNLEPESNGTPEGDDEAFNEYNSHKFWYITPDIKLDWDVVCDGHFDIPSRRAEFVPPTDFNQDIVPVEILESYVTMVRNGEYAEARLTCAYDFPAVAFTIGKQNWHILRNLLQYLCDELDWKVRKTVASFIGVLAVILGREIVSRDLVPIFIGLFKDLDEIKIKAIENFAKFLKFVDFPKHEEILPNIGKCLRIDSNTNWRIRESLAQQILIIIKWYDSINRHDYLLYLASVTCIFLQDKISCIREIGAEAMAEIIRIFNPTQRKAIIKYYLAKKFSLSYTWRKRQTFVNIFYKYIKANKNVMDLVQMVLPDIKRLSYDAVPNIRLLVAKSLVELVNNDANILTSGDCEDVDIMKIIRRLQEDDDRDVRETAYMVELPGSGRKESVTMPTVTTTTSTTDLTNVPVPSQQVYELKTTDNDRLEAASTNSTMPANNSETVEMNDDDDTNVVATCVDLNSSPVP